ncbi:MAG TPA: rhodanese-like domain-containing protein [Dehalococcoidia bacterium]
MEVISFVHEGLGNTSYVVDVGGGQAIAVDPDRTARRYLQSAEGKGLTIAAVLETHVHADFVTGAVEVKTATDATIYNPKDSDAEYAHHPVGGGDTLRIGDADIEVVSAPGHTPEHIAYVVRAPGSEPVLFSGGSIIVGGAARTDLLTPQHTEPLSRSQYRTLREGFRDLPDSTLLHPTHGSGSFCSAGAGGDRSSTLGEQRAMNPALAEMTEDEFVEWFPGTFPGVPEYYWRMRSINQGSPRLRRDIADPKALDAHHFESAGRRSVIVDVRTPEEHLAGHIQGSLSNPFRDVFGVWLGWLVELGTPLSFVCDGQPLERVIDECLLVGHEELTAVLDGGFAAWERAGLPVSSDPYLSPADARKTILDGAFVLDVREPDEWAVSRVEGALHIPLGSLQDRLAEVPRDIPVLAYCGGGYRSSSAASVLERAGIETVMSVRGGFSAWVDAGEPVVA